MSVGVNLAGFKGDAEAAPEGLVGMAKEWGPQERN